MMSRVQKGIVAGLIGTAAVSVLEIGNMLLGHRFLPFPSIVAYMVGMPGNLAVGWIAHFVAGALVLGPLFGILCPRMPTDTPETKGILFAVGSFVVLMLVIFTVGSERMFRGADGFGTMAWLLITNMVFGFAMGWVYGRLVEREKRAARMAPDTVPAH